MYTPKLPSSKYVSENNALSLFEELFDVENKNSFTNTEEIENKFRHSFTLYQPKEKEKEETSQTNIHNIWIWLLFFFVICIFYVKFILSGHCNLILLAETQNINTNLYYYNN